MNKFVPYRIKKFGNLGVVIFLCAITVAFTSIEPPSSLAKLGIKTVVIDAGHGGRDVGCPGGSGILNEKEITLNIALKLGKHIEENFTDVKVIYTRKADKFIELHERARIANDNNADLFICVHANSGPSAAYGSETYVMGLHKNEANLMVAKRENSAILMEDNHEVHYEGFDPNSEEDVISLTLMQSAFLEQSLRFATKIQSGFQSIGRRNRGVKQAGFLVLYKTTMPSVLIETGFITNKKEGTFLSTDSNQEIMANTIFKAFQSYKSEVEKNMEGIESDKNDTQNSINKELPVEKSDDKPGEKGKNGLIDEKNNEDIKSSNEDLKGPKNPPLYEHRNVVLTEPKGKLALDSTDVGNDSEPVPIKSFNLSDKLIYTVQIITSGTRLNMDHEGFSELGEVYEREEGGVFKYYFGQEKTLSDISNSKKSARDKGFSDAFVVIFNEGKRINLSEALKLEGGKK